MKNNPRPKQLLDYISQCDLPPTYRQIAADCDFCSISEVHYYIKLLMANGLITQLPGKMKTTQAKPHFYDSNGDRWFIIAQPKRRCKCGNEELINGIEPPYCPNCKRRLVSI